MALLEVDRLSKAFAAPAGRRDMGATRWLRAVDGVSFQVEAGEAVGLVGPSGCGKSTLATLLARLADADSGAIRFGGVDIAGVAARRVASAPWRSRVQMVFQDPLDSLDPRETVQQAIAGPLRRLCGLRGERLNDRVMAVTAQVHLAPPLLRRLPHQLSGGEAARVAIARALAVGPDLLILDEPTSALDVSVQAVVLKLLDQCRRELGVALLMVSHDPDVVRLLCSRTISMRDGRFVDAAPHPV